MELIVDSHNLEKGRISSMIYATTIMGILRILRSWNQTGQKHAGEPDIAKDILPTHNFILWTLVLVTYMDVTQRMALRIMPGASRLIAVSCSITLCLAALAFKIAFTKADAPELLFGLQTFILRSMEEASLVAQARAVFIGIIFLACLTGGPYRSQSLKVTESGKGCRLHLNIRIMKAKLRSRVAATTPRSHDPLSDHRVSSHQYSYFRSLRTTIPSNAVIKSLALRDIIDLHPIPVCIILRIWRVQCHILCRPFQRI